MQKQEGPLGDDSSAIGEEPWAGGEGEEMVQYVDPLELLGEKSAEDGAGAHGTRRT